MSRFGIQWKKKDYIRLGKAVSDFNKKIKELQVNENINYLPNLEEYSEVKKTIATRQELNRVINSLRRFQKEGAEDLYKTEAGEELTIWEYNELNRLRKQAIKRLNEEKAPLEEPISSGFSKAQMGSSEYKRLQANIENISKLEELKGYEFQSLKQRLRFIGASDYVYKKAVIYKQNYLEELEKYSSFDNYDLLIKKINNLSPERFYEVMSATELTKDLTYQSDQMFTQEDFNAFLLDLGIDVDNTEKVDKDVLEYKYNITKLLS